MEKGKITRYYRCFYKSITVCLPGKSHIVKKFFINTMYQIVPVICIQFCGRSVDFLCNTVSALLDNLPFRVAIFYFFFFFLIFVLFFVSVSLLSFLFLFLQIGCWLFLLCILSCHFALYGKKITQTHVYE